MSRAAVVREQRRRSRGGAARPLDALRPRSGRGTGPSHSAQRVQGSDAAQHCPHGTLFSGRTIRDARRGRRLLQCPAWTRGPGWNGSRDSLAGTHATSRTQPGRCSGSRRIFEDIERRVAAPGDSACGSLGSAGRTPSHQPDCTKSMKSAALSRHCAPPLFLVLLLSPAGAGAQARLENSAKDAIYGCPMPPPDALAVTATRLCAAQWDKNKLGCAADLWSALAQNAPAEPMLQVRALLEIG